MSRKAKHRWGRWSITQFSSLARFASGMDRGSNGLSSIKSWPSRCEGDMQDSRDIKIQAKNCTEEEAEAKSSILLPTFLNLRHKEYIEDPLPTTYLKVSKLCSQPGWWSFGWHFHSNEIWLHRLTVVAKPNKQITAAESMKRFISAFLCIAQRYLFDPFIFLLFYINEQRPKSCAGTTSQFRSADSLWDVHVLRVAFWAVLSKLSSFPSLPWLSHSPELCWMLNSGISLWCSMEESLILCKWSYAHQQPNVILGW